MSETKERKEGSEKESKIDAKLTHERQVFIG